MADPKHTPSDSLVSFEAAIRTVVHGDKAHTVPSLFDRAAWPFGWPAEVIGCIRRLVVWLVAQGTQARAFVRDGRQFNYLRWRRMAEIPWAREEATIKAFRLECVRHNLALGLEDPLLGILGFRDLTLAGMVRRFMKEVEDLAGEAWVDLQGFPAQASESDLAQSAQPEPKSGLEPQLEPRQSEPEPSLPPQSRRASSASGEEPTPAVRELMRILQEIFPDGRPKDAQGKLLQVKDIAIRIRGQYPGPTFGDRNLAEALRRLGRTDPKWKTPRSSGDPQ